jgi:hypothetical protein
MTDTEFDLQRVRNLLASVLLSQLSGWRERAEDLSRELDMQYKYIEWLEQYAPKAGEFNLAWDAYEAQMEEEE